MPNRRLDGECHSEETMNRQQVGGEGSSMMGTCNHNREVPDREATNLKAASRSKTRTKKKARPHERKGTGRRGKGKGEGTSGDKSRRGQLQQHEKEKKAERRKTTWESTPNPTATTGDAGGKKNPEERKTKNTEKRT